MVKVLKSGFYTSIQDQGRFGYRGFGVPISGAMDSYSSQFANTILGNNIDNAVIEMTMIGPVLQFYKPTQIAISGANMNPKLNGELIKANKLIQINARDILSFGIATKGVRSYLAIYGGFSAKDVLDSKSMYKVITESWRLSVGDSLNYADHNSKSKNQNASLKFHNSIFDSDTLVVTEGPEFLRLSKNVQNQLVTKEFKVTKHNNRMAYQLEPLFENHIKSILTSPVLPGTIQLTPSGQLIVLMRDCQTTGGYPRVLQLTEKSINILSQKIDGNSLKFRLKD